jgi:hypothetical protein
MIFFKENKLKMDFYGKTPVILVVGILDSNLRRQPISRLIKKKKERERCGCKK